MAEDNRRVSTTPIPVPVPFGALPPAAPTPSPLSQTPVAVAPLAPEETPNATEATESVSKDVAMADVDRAPSPAPAAATPTPTPTPANGTSGASPAPPARTGTPLRATGTGEANNSRAASQHPDPGFIMPAETAPHGAPVRQYLNTKVTGALLDGMKLIAKEQPKDPLRALGEYLLQRSKEVEGSA